jgi:hypothetical protein
MRRHGPYQSNICQLGGFALVAGREKPPGHRTVWLTSLVQLSGFEPGGEGWCVFHGISLDDPRARRAARGYAKLAVKREKRRKDALFLSLDWLSSEGQTRSGSTWTNSTASPRRPGECADARALKTDRVNPNSR